MEVVHAQYATVTDVNLCNCLENEWTNKFILDNEHKMVILDALLHVSVSAILSWLINVDQTWHYHRNDMPFK